MKPKRAASAFRDFEATDQPSVREFYRQNHAEQTLAFGRAKREEYLPLRRCRMSVWAAIEALESVVDASDPDTSLSQLDHALQTAEALRADGAARWLTLTGFLHDLGKVLCLFGEPQWAVVGDTYPVGCAFSPDVVFHELFEANPDVRDARYATPRGIYQDGAGLEQLVMSWGHDEYLYHVLRDYLPDPALAIVRYHSFYAWHREGAYESFMTPGDRQTLAWVRRFNPYDLYSKADDPPDHAALRPYYEELVAAFLPDELDW